MNYRLFASAAVGGCLGAALAQASIVTWNATLAGTNENPPNASPGSGFVSGTLDDGTGALTLSGTFSGLLASATASHIHRAPAGTNGPVIVPLTATNASSGTLSLPGPTALAAADIANLLSGGLYINVHTSVLPGGEIRGQIHVVPEPAALGGLLVGTAALLLRRRRG